MPAKNSIKKIILDFEYNGKVGNSSLAGEMTKNIFYDHLVAIIDKSLERRNVPENIRIDKLEIDLDTTTVDDLPLLVERELERLLSQYDTLNNYKNETVENHTQHKNDNLEILLFFLSKGVLPWYAEAGVADINKEFGGVLKTNELQLRDALIKLFAVNDVALSRFIVQLNPQYIQWLFFALTVKNEHYAFLKEWYLFITKRKPLAMQEALKTLFTFVIQNSTIAAHNEFVSKFTEQVITPYFSLPATAVNPVVAYLIGKAYAPTLSKKHRNIKPPLDKIFPSLALWIAGEMKELQNVMPVTASQVKSKAPTEKGTQDNETGSEGIYINNAGLVILNPYLQMFFTRLKLVEGDTFINFKSQLKAVQVLQYLVTGKLNTPEHLLPLCKLICGIDMPVPVPLKLRLSKTEKQDCDVLLQALINNWKQLKNTSIEGLRETFIQRDGVLRKDENNWVMNVERKTWDILLDDLPWQFRLLKFPWNEYIVHVQW